MKIYLIPVLAVIAFHLIRWIFRRRVAHDLPRLTLLQRLAVRLMLLTSSRKALPVEFRQCPDEAEEEICILFFAPRAVLKLELWVSDLDNVKIREVRLELGDQSWIPCYSLKLSAGEKSEGKITITLADQRLINRIRVSIDPNVDPFEYRCTIKLTEKNYADAALLLSAGNDLKEARFRTALTKYEKYFEHSDANPFVLSQLARLNSHVDKKKEAVEYAIRFYAVGGGEEAGNLYRSLIQDEQFISAAEIKRLQEERAEWQVTGRHGIVRLANHEFFQLGLNDCYFFSRRQIFVVERRAAGRRLTRLDFPLRSGCAVLHTALRLIRADGTEETLPLERFHIGDSPERNIFISLLSERQGTWTLPDLHTGDIVEMIYHTLTDSGSPESNADFFVLQPLVCLHPTLEYLSMWKHAARTEVDLRAYNCDGEFDTRVDSDNRHQVRQLKLERSLPNAGSQGWSDAAQHMPMCACASAGVSWQNVVEKAIARNIGSTELSEILPTEIAEVVAGADDELTKLRLGFYWIRDCIKYGSHVSGKNLIGNPDRGQSIVRARLGDCNDKAYLMALFCKRLGLEVQFVLVSQEPGIVLPDMPANQFDHIIVRTRLAEHWVYLDPTGNLAAFDMLSPALQGMRGLVLDNDAELVELPESPPGTNAIRIWESLTQRDHNWLRGDFKLEVSGMIGRWADELFKEASMEADDLLRGASGVIQRFLPRQILLGIDKDSDTGSSDLLSLSGHHCRCQLSRTGATAIGIIHWREPSLPLYDWRSKNLKGSFEFSFPLEIEVNLEIAGDLRNCLETLSEPLDFENKYCSITSRMHEEPSRVTLQRKIVVLRKRIVAEDLHLVTETLENLERSLQLAIVIRR